MNLKVIKIDNLEFKFQPMKPIEYWEVVDLINNSPRKSFQVLADILCDRNIIEVSDNVGKRLDKQRLSVLANDANLPHNFLFKLYDEFMTYINETNESIEGVKKN